jgi:hypothetical protein
MAGAGDSEGTFRNWKREDVLAKWMGYARAVRDRYISLPNYRRIDGRPVLMHGGVDRMEFYVRFDITPKEIVEAIRHEIPDAYLIATNTAPEYYGKLKQIGFDAFTEYLWYSDSWKNVCTMYRQKWAEGVMIAKQYGLHYWVPATSGYDSEAWGNPVSAKFVPTPPQFLEHLVEARLFASQHYGQTKGQVVVYSWNEFGESPTAIEPTVRNGDAYLRAFREAVAA